MSKLLETFQELNLSNYGPDDVDQLNAWAIDAYAELSALKAQEPAFMWHKGATEDESEVVDVDCACPCCVPLYAAPVSEAKAQGVVMQSTDGGRNPRYEGLFDGETEEQRASRLNATPVQQVSVPDGKVCVPVEVLRLYEFMAASFTPFTSQHEQIAISLRKAKAAMLNAAPAAPAADAGLVEAFCKVEQALDLIGGIRHGKNVTQDELWQSCELLDAALATHRAQGVV